MMTFRKGKAKTPTLCDLYGQNILDAISKIKQQAFENYESTNGPSMMNKTTDAQLGIDNVVLDLMEIYKKYQEVK